MPRPTKPADAETITKLAAIGCTQREIAEVAGVSERTLRRRFSAEFERGRAMACVSLRRSQWALAMKGDARMLRWLGIQFLGQRDRPDDRPAASDDYTIDLSAADPA